MKKIINLMLIAMIFITLAGCDNKENDIPKEIKTVEGEIVGISDDMIYLAIGEKTYSSTDFIYDKNDNITDFKRGDLVEISYYDEPKEDQTGKKYTINYLESIKKTDVDYLYKDEYKISDLVPFEIKEMNYKIRDPYEADKVLESFNVKDEELKSVLEKLNEVTLYSDANLMPYIGGYSHIIEFIGINDEICIINDHGEVDVEYNSDKKVYGYHFIEDETKELSVILDEFFGINNY